MAKPDAKTDKLIDALYKDVEQYLKAKGWKIVIIGPVAIQQWPGNLKYNWEVAVRFLGSSPKEQEKK